MRLDVKGRAMQGGDSGAAIVAGKPSQSSLIERVVSDDESDRMPPEGAPLTEEEVERLRDWIQAGAEWTAGVGQEASRHWAFQPIVRPATPQPQNVDWVRNPIDAFVLRRLEKENIAPSPEADRATLIRRVYLDLLGLPPSVEQLRAFEADGRPDAYQKMVDAALESEHYGERWGRHWLDLARYADSDGYEKDRQRPNAWRYRQWVIEALNQDMPFDQFTIDQIAGDLRPDAGVAQQLAVGFHRNTLHNTEGGTDKEEDRVKKTVDRLNTIGSTWLGLTVGCAQCHSHKYDPITQREYYQLYAFMNNMDEKDLPAPTSTEQAELEAALAKHQARLEKLETARTSYLEGRLPAAQRKWEATASQQPGWKTLPPAAATSTHKAELKIEADDSVLATGANVVSDTYRLAFTLGGAGCGDSLGSASR